MKKKAIIIGCGAAGMMCAVNLSNQGYKVTVFEKNDKPGKKLFITGKGRCNLTNNCSEEELLKNVVTNPKFMYSAFYNFNAYDTIEFFEKEGLRLKTERGNRVFPISDHSSDVINTLVAKLNKLNVEINYNTTVKDIITEETEKEEIDTKKTQEKKDKFEKKAIGVTYITKDTTKKMYADKIIVATGGVTYPMTGSTGDGILWAQKLGLKTTDLKPALVSVLTKENFVKDIMGLALKNVTISFVTKVKNKDKTVYSEFGEMLFTHNGISGPIVLSATSHLHKYDDQIVKIYIDLKPALTVEQLDERIIRDFNSNINKQFRNAISDLMPKNLLPHVIEMSGIDPFKKVNEISKEERQRFVKCVKNFELTMNGYGGMNEAIITQGGVNVKEINPQSMEAKRIKNLYYIGEALDVDALTGGYNLQIAWSTAMSVI